MLRKKIKETKELESIGCKVVFKFRESLRMWPLGNNPKKMPESILSRGYIECSACLEAPVCCSRVSEGGK